MCYRSDLQHMTVLRGSGWVDYEALAQASATAAAASAALAQTARDLAQGYLLASQMLAAGTRVSEHPPFTGGGPWQMTVNVVAVMDVFVDGRKLARTDWTASAAAQPLVTNTSGEFINAQSQVCIQYV